MTRVLLAGDHFVLNSTMRDALARDDLELRELVLPWPVEPFGPVAEVDEASGTEEQMIEALDGAEICLTQMGPITERVLTASPGLKLVCVGRGGPVNINLAAADARGVTVCNTPGRNATATAEHTVALILAAVRSVPQRHAELRSGEWRSDHYRFDAVGPELRGSTVGLVGCGAIGRRVARILAGFEARVVCYDPHVSVDGVEQVDTLTELLERSLVVSLHARLTPDTTDLIGRSEIRSMLPGGILVNAARGGLLDYDAVADALEAGHLYAAAFDVFPAEPLPADSRLHQLDNVIMTPHLAGASKQTAVNAARFMAAEVRRYMAGEPPAHPATPH